jgi:hypothetical protein
MRGITAILFLLLTFSSVLSAQKPRLQYWLNYSAGISYRIIANDPSMRSALNALETPLVVHGGDFQLDIPLNRRIGIVTGFGFLSYGEKVTLEYNEISFPDEVDPYYGFVYETYEGFTIADRTLRYYHNYIKVPLGIRWSIKEKRESSLNIHASVTANFYLYSKQRNTQKFPDGEVNHSTNDYKIPARSFVPGAALGLLYSKGLGENLKIQFGPQFDILLTSMYGSDYLVRLPYRVGFAVGIGL